MNMETKEPVLYVQLDAARVKSAKKASGYRWKDLSELGVSSSISPALSTGVRVRLIAAAGLASALDVPISSLIVSGTAGPKYAIQDLPKAVELPPIADAFTLTTPTEATLEPPKPLTLSQAIDALGDALDVVSDAAKVQASQSDRYRELVAIMSPNKALTHSEAKVRLSQLVNEASKLAQMKGLLA